MHRGLPARLALGPADDQQAEPASRRTLAARYSAVAALRVPVPGRAFAAITVAPALLAMAWLVPGTGLLLAGRLLALPMVIIFVPLAVALCYFVMGRLPVSWPRFNEAEPDAAPVAVRPRSRTCRPSRCSPCSRSRPGSGCGKRSCGPSRSS